MKILVVADVVILVALIIILMTLKGGYEEQAKRTANEQESAYLEKNTQVLVEQWRSVDQYSMAWKLVYTVLSGAKSEAAFKSALAAIESDKRMPVSSRFLTFILALASMMLCRTAFTKRLALPKVPSSSRTKRALRKSLAVRIAL